MTLNRSDVIARIAERSGLTTAQADSALGALQEVLEGALHDGTPVRITGFLTLARTDRAARAGRHPRTGEPLTIPAGPAVRITPGSALKAAARG